MKELWRNIDWYKGMYQISSFGRLRSFKNNLPRILKTRVNKSWYTYVNLSMYGKYRSITIHRLVAIAFLWKSNLTVNHKNWNKRNNCVDNLEWISANDNHLHAQKHRLLARWEKNWRSKLTYKDVKLIRYKYSKWKSQRFLSREFWVSRPVIYKIINNINWN